MIMRQLRVPQILQNVFSNRGFSMSANKANFSIKLLSTNCMAYKGLSAIRNMSALSCKDKMKSKLFNYTNTPTRSAFTHDPSLANRLSSSFPKRSTYQQTEAQKLKNKTTLYYCMGFIIFVGGFTYGSVVLYRLYCQTTGKGGRAVLDEAGEKISKMLSDKNRIINVQFSADINSTMLWNFKPAQPFINVAPGETALAFYTAYNPTERPITGVATYNIVPYEAGRYFNKIQCFCFEEQQLNSHEEVDMPVFFYVDPEYAEDPRLEKVDQIMLSYTFFEAKEGFQITFPTFT